MYDANKSQVDTRSGDMHMDMMIVKCLLFKNINPTRMWGMKKQTAAITYVRMKFQLFIRKMTVGVMNGLLIMTPK
jgi:hypothetical protein